MVILYAQDCLLAGAVSFGWYHSFQDETLYAQQSGIYSGIGLAVHKDVVEVVRLASMTAEERRIANAALVAGPWDSHDQISIAVADRLGLEAQLVEKVLYRLRIRMVLVCVSAANTASETASVRYQRGMDWTEGE